MSRHGKRFARPRPALFPTLFPARDRVSFAQLRHVARRSDRSHRCHRHHRGGDPLGESRGGERPLPGPGAARAGRAGAADRGAARHRERDRRLACARSPPRYDHVFTSGGVGPTHDDVTLPAVAAAFDMRLQRHPELELLIRRALGAEMHERDLRMADIPEGARLMYGDPPDPGAGRWWPCTTSSSCPGVPQIFRRKFDGLRSLLRAGPIYTARALLPRGRGAHRRRAGRGGGGVSRRHGRAPTRPGCARPQGEDHPRRPGPGHGRPRAGPPARAAGSGRGAYRLKSR